MHSDERTIPGQLFSAYHGVPDKAIRGPQLQAIGVFNDRRSAIDVADENAEFEAGATRLQ